MKKRIEVLFDTDRAGNGFLRIHKEKGKLSIEEIRQAIIDFGEQDYYGLIIKCMDEDVAQYYEDDLPGDEVMLYPVDAFLRETGHVNDREVNA